MNEELIFFLIVLFIFGGLKAVLLYKLIRSNYD
jgi:hypothetical protein